MRLVMRRFTSVLISILLGALAVGVGMGYFLMKANNDRERLALIAQAAEQESQEAIQAREQAIKAANAKLDAANTEITKAQETIKAFNEERALIQSATVLRTPNAKEIKGWSEIVSLGQKATVNYPRHISSPKIRQNPDLGTSDEHHHPNGR
jgi:type II secretory pathway pseudopilin PulG